MRLLVPIAACVLAACGGEPATRPAAEPQADGAATLPFSPAPATVHRLTDAAWRNSVRDVLGVGYGGELPLDYRLYGFASVGASEVSIAPRDLELYEEAAWTLARSVVRDAAARDALVGCDLDPIPGATDADARAAQARAATCVQAFLGDLLTRAWRRPPTLTELQAVTGVFTGVRAELGSATVGLQAALATALLSPHFVFRVEHGEPDPDAPTRRRYSSVEMASRLSYAILGTTPDAELAAAGRRGDLVTDAGVRRQASRLLDQRLAQDHLSGFFAEMLDLDRLDNAEKSPDLYPQDSPALRAAMADEVVALFEQIALEEDRPLGELFTTRRTWLTDPELARLYGLELDDGALPGWFEIPGSQARGGLLGRAAFLAIHAAATESSPTRRGKAMRVRLLCGNVPPPPEGVVTSLEESAEVEGSLRDRLEQHATDPTCAACHDLVDPLGYPLERFGALGEWRADDHGFPIDTSGELDGVAVADAEGLGAAVAAHEDLGACFARNTYRFATGQLEGEHQEAAVAALGLQFDEAGRRVRDLVLAVVLSEGFRAAAAPSSGACDEDADGATRACATACGQGEETCRDGAWVGCTASAPSVEVCDGEDNDCDGDIDEAVVSSCDADSGALGVAVCRDGDWGACAAPAAPDETCDGLDDDGDGAIDEDLAVGLEVVSFTELTEDGHPDCDPAANPDAPACRAAVNRFCRALDCYATGTGVVATDEEAELATIACLSADEGVVVETTFTELSTHHGGCTASVRQSRDCNAAINRFCRARGDGTGFGPVENSGDIAVVVCNPGAATPGATYPDLAELAHTCDGYNNRSGPVCNTAFHRYCRDAGYTTGHGPLEHSGDNAAVACLGGAE